MGKRHYRRYLSPDLVEELKQIRESERAERHTKDGWKQFYRILGCTEEEIEKIAEERGWYEDQ